MCHAHWYHLPAVMRHVIIKDDLYAPLKSRSIYCSHLSIIMLGLREDAVADEALFKKTQPSLVRQNGKRRGQPVLSSFSKQPHNSILLL